MRSRCKNIAFLLMAGLITIASIAQQNITIRGNVRNSKTNEGLPAVSILLKGSGLGSYTDERGHFYISVPRLPATLTISSIGFATQEVNVTSSSQSIDVAMQQVNALAQDVVVSASRVAERILESPVSIERVSAAAIRNTPAASYYDAIGSLKGVDLTTSSIAFKTPSTRGFNGSGNTRFNQLVDGMDNQAPGLNFAVGSIIGLTELDVESMELLPGASSALYGSGGMNGTLLITSKSPFKYQGLSFQVKQGINHIDNYQRKPAPYYDYSLRWGKKVSEKFAFKIGAQFIKAQDWQAQDKRNLLRNNVISAIKPGDRTTDPNYDGVNIFGDEASASMQAFAQAVRAQVGASGGGAALTGLDAMIAGGLTPQQIATTWGTNPALSPLAQYLPFLIPTSAVTTNPYKGTFGPQYVSRTGYDESDLVDYNTYNVRGSVGLNYKITDDLEAIFLGFFGTGTSVYTAADRYALKDFSMGQYKLELKSKNWFIRGYTTQENSGNSYTATTAALYINNAWKSNQNWFSQYTGTYGAARLGILPGVTTPLPDAQSHAAARSVAETGRVSPGTAAFDQAFNNAIGLPIGVGGSKFTDRTNLYHFEGQYNFAEKIKFAEVLMGANFRSYQLNSKGTIFADTTGKIGINEYGAYVQVQKKFIRDILKLTGSLRYDKNKNFDGRFTPRLSAIIRVAEDNNIRMSFQTAYRFPTVRDQYINLLTGGSTRLIGGLPSFNTFFKFPTNPAYTAQSVLAYRASYNAGTPNPALLQVAKFDTIKPETMNSYELGYRGLLTKKLLIDAYGYFSRYKDFNSRIAAARGKSGNPAAAATDLVSPFTTDNISFVINSPTPVKGFGYGIGLEYKVIGDYSLSGNFFSDELKDVPAGLITYFNAPKYRFNVGFSNSDAYKGWGFNVAYRWQDKVNWEGDFGSGEIPSYGTLDLMISHKFTSIRSLLKIGATNVTNKYYRSAFGNPEVGGLYYISFAYNVF